MSEEGLAGWEHKSNEQKAKEIEVAFGEEFEYIEVEEEEEKNKMEEKKEIKEEKEEVKKYKDMTEEEQTERNKDILLRLGFFYKVDKGQFIYKEGDTFTIGKTFNDKYPKGSQFWGFKGGKKLENGELKEQPIVKRFYTIREGKEEMPEKKEEEKKEEKTKEIAVRGEEIVEIKPNQVIMDAQLKADSLYAVVEKQHLFMQIHEKKYLTLEAWEILGKFCNLTATVEWVKPVEMWDEKGFEARVVVTDSEGKVVSIAESMCMSDEGNWKGKPIFQLKSMAQTRAMSKAYRMCLSFIVSLAGYSPTPYEEMSE